MESATTANSQKDLDFELVVIALEAISRDRPSDDPGRPGFESALAEIRSQHQYANNQDTSITVQTSSLSDGNMAAHNNLPPGLANLRNTCYLNSILQYLYTVKAVRNLVESAQPAEPLEQTQVAFETRLQGIPPATLRPGQAFLGSECKLSHHPK